MVCSNNSDNQNQTKNSCENQQRRRSKVTEEIDLVSQGDINQYLQGHQDTFYREHRTRVSFMSVSSVGRQHRLSGQLSVIKVWSSSRPLHLRHLNMVPVVCAGCTAATSTPVRDWPGPGEALRCPGEDVGGRGAVGAAQARRCLSSSRARARHLLPPLLGHQDPADGDRDLQPSSVTSHPGLKPADPAPSSKHNGRS